MTLIQTVSPESATGEVAAVQAAANSMKKFLLASIGKKHRRKDERRVKLLFQVLVKNML